MHLLPSAKRSLSLLLLIATLFSVMHLGNCTTLPNTSPSTLGVQTRGRRVFPTSPTYPALSRKQISSPPSAASSHSPPPHVNDFYEKLMMLESPPKGKRGGRERARKVRRGEEGEGELAEVGVVFPVNTELQRVRGEGLSRGNAEERTAGRKKTRNLVCVSKWT